MKNKILLIILLAFYSLNLASSPKDIENLSLSDPETLGLDGAIGYELDSIVKKYIDDKKIQGAVLAVSRDQNPVYFSAHGLADVTDKIPMRRDSMFQMWSSGKAILGIAAMIAIDKGLFDPSDEVSQYIPNFKKVKVAVLAEPKDRDISPLYVYGGGETDPGFFSKLYSRLISWWYEGVYLGSIPDHRLVPKRTPLTVHHLLTHTAGVATGGLGQALAPWNAKLSSGKEKNVSEEQKNFIENITIKSFTDMLAEGPLDFQPGSRWQYSGFGGLDVVARIIEITSGQPFNEFVQTNIFDPLQMTDTHWIVPKEKLERIVKISGGSKDGSEYPAFETKFFSGSVGLVSTTKDYLNLHHMLANGGIFNEIRILSEKSLKLMSSNQTGNLYSKTEKGEGLGMGFGYAVDITLDSDNTIFKRGTGSFGTGGAAGTMSWSDPINKMAVVIMVQQPTADFANEIADIIFRSLKKN